MGTEHVLAIHRDPGQLGLFDHVVHQRPFEREDFLGGYFEFPCGVHLHLAHVQVKLLVEGIGQIQGVNLLGEAGDEIGVTAPEGKIRVEVEQACDFDVMEHLCFEPGTNAAHFPVVAPVILPVGGRAVGLHVRHVEAVTGGIDPGGLQLEHPLQGKLLDDRIVLVLIERGCGPGAVHLGLPGEFADQ